MTTSTPRGCSTRSIVVGDLGGEPLLHLGPPGVGVDQPGQLRQAGDAAVVVRDVGHVGLADERHQVVLAERVERDVPHHDHLVVAGLEGDVEDARRGRSCSPPKISAYMRGHPCGRALQAVAVGVLADRLEDLADRLLDPRPRRSTPHGLDVGRSRRVVAPASATPAAGALLPLAPLRRPVRGHVGSVAQDRHDARRCRASPSRPARRPGGRASPGAASRIARASSWASSMSRRTSASMRAGHLVGVVGLVAEVAAEEDLAALLARAAAGRARRSCRTR